MSMRLSLVYRVCLLAAGLAGCVPGSPAPPPSAPALELGTIVSVRPVVASPTAASRILIAAPGGGATERRAFEFIIRTDDGRTLSVVQSNDANFRTGDRVALTAGARTRLARD